MVQVSNQFEESSENINRTGEGRQLRPARKGENRIGEGVIKRGLGGVKSILGLGKGEEKPKPKIYFIEVLIMLPILAIADIFDWFSLTGAGAVLSWAIDVLATGILSAWLFLKRRKVGWSIAMGALEMAPVAELFTIRSVVFIIFLIRDGRIIKKLLGSSEK